MRRRNLRVGDSARFHADRGKEFFIEPQEDGTLKIGSLYTFTVLETHWIPPRDGTLTLKIAKIDREADQEVESHD